ncbi:MAG: paraquat-inducible protein A [Proteobacteria bacterium]|nr:MAG: paraquat-inducible protein A [Pseudomonadota bacterium]
MTREELESLDCRTTRACHECDLLQQLPDLDNGEVARCQRCGALLRRIYANSLDYSLALAITGLILFLVANLFPLISLKVLGITQHGNLISATLALFNADMPSLGLLILFTTILFPLFSLLGMIYVFTTVRMNHFTPAIAPLFRFLRSTDAWGMLEIFLLALIVAAVKLADITEVIAGISLYAFIMLIITLTVLSLTLNPDDVWDHLRKSKP